MLCLFLLMLRSAGSRSGYGLDMIVHLLDFGHHWILCQRFFQSLRLGPPLQLMRAIALGLRSMLMVQFLALRMASRRLVQNAFGSLILMLQSRMLVAMILIMEALRRQMLQIIISVRSVRLITTRRNMAIVADIFLRL